MFMFEYPRHPGDENRQQILGPASKSEGPAWLEKLRRSRLVEHAYRAFDSSRYENPRTAWTQSNFVQTLALIEDRYLFDPATQRYTVDRFLDDLLARYGGIDSVILWMMYPNIGIDNRNQFDHLRDLPGGIPALQKMIADFHRRNVRVLFPVKPWDVGTRDEGQPMWTVWAHLLQQLNADGLFGDTYYGIPFAYQAAADSLNLPVVFEPENAFAWEESSLSWNLMSWAVWSHPAIPAVSRYKWTEPRHMLHFSDRWARDKTNLLQAALFNGTGFEPWENIWGTWNAMTPRDGEATRRIYTILRAFPDLLASPDWQPHAPTLQQNVFASRWPCPKNSRTLFTLINRNEVAINSPQLVLPHSAGTRYFDLYHGIELSASISGDTATLAFPLESHGYGAILATSSETPELQSLLATMRTLSAKPLADFSAQWKPLPQTIAPIAKTSPHQSAPEGMLKIPAARFHFQVSGIMVEGLDRAGVGVQFPWEDSPRRHHAHTLDIPAFYLDRTPVTNSQFKSFLDATRYSPADSHNFLKHWQNQNTITPGTENHPVTWVSLEDARAYCTWANKRLPHDWEWHYAAAGTDNRLYPWGNTLDLALLPPQHSGRDLPPPSPVASIPANASPFGILDLVGLVWQFTDEFTDDHTRAVILRGGSYYTPACSQWYFPQAHRLDHHGKYLLVSPSRDRAATLGFRCAADCPP